MEERKIFEAFSLVNPRRVFQEMARRGMVSQEAADRISWKCRIHATLTLEELDAAGVTPDLVAAAILYMTRTHAKVTPCVVYETPWLSFWPKTGKSGFQFTALGAMSSRHTSFLTHPDPTY